MADQNEKKEKALILSARVNWSAEECQASCRLVVAEVPAAPVYMGRNRAWDPYHQPQDDGFSGLYLVPVDGVPRGADSRFKVHGPGIQATFVPLSAPTRAQAEEGVKGEDMHSRTEVYKGLDKLA